jgi:hypothetical protein
MDFRCRKAGFALQPLDFQCSESASALFATHRETSPRLQCNLPARHAELGFLTTAWIFSGVIYLDRAVPLAWSKYSAK